MKNYIFFLFILFFSSCAYNDDFILPSQDLSYYESKDFYINDDISAKLKDDYLNNFFSAWSDEKTNINMNEFANNLLNEKSYSENYQPYDKEFLKQLINNADFKNLNSVFKNAIIIHSSNVRLLPTKKPRFKNPNLAGEGYPFDYLQNSFIYAYTPVKISHFSKDFGWSFIYNSFIVGFVEDKNIAFISDDDLNALKSSIGYISPKKDKIPLIDKNNDFVEYARIGMLLALSKESANYYTIKAFKKGINNQAKLVEIKVSKEDFFKLGSSFSSKDLKNIANELIGQNYGWGGMNGNRDCSAFLKDVFGSFGIYLKRNSQDQIMQKDYLNRSNFINIGKLNNKEKYKYIKTHAIPFASLLALKGHIVLYLGEFNDKMYILHNLWGIKNYNSGKESRIVVGKVAITTIDAGSNLRSVKNSDVILSKIYGIRNLFIDEISYEK